MVLNRTASRMAHLAWLALIVVLCGCASGLAANGAAKADKPAGKAVEKLPVAEIMQAGDDAARSGDLGRAMNFYNQALEIEPSADLWYRVGWIYNRLDKKSQALQGFAQAIEMSPDHAAANEELGLLLLQGKGREQAATYLRRAVELEPQRWRAHNALGALADGAGHYDEARGHYEAALAARPGSAMILNNLGYSYYMAGNFSQAAEQYRLALEAEPGNRATIANLGLLDARQKRYEQALDVLAKAMDKPKAYNDVGYVAFQNGDLEVAERLLSEATRLSPSYYETAHQNLKRVREAIAEAEAAAADAPAATADNAVPVRKGSPAKRATR